MVGEIKVNTKAQLDITYIRLLLDVFVPYQEVMLAYLDELIVKHDPQLVNSQLKEVERQRNKRSNEEEHLLLSLSDVDASEQKKIMRVVKNIWGEEDVLHQICKELAEKLTVENHSQRILKKKQEDIKQLLKRREEMIEEGTWERVGGKDNMAHVFSLLGADSVGFGFSEISLQASPINDIFDWMKQYRPDLLPPGNPFPPSPAPKQIAVPEKNEALPQPKTEFLQVPDEVTANIRTFLTIRRPGYTLASLLDRSQDGKRAWLALLTRKLHDDTVERISDVIIELKPNKYMSIQNVQNSPADQQSPEPHEPS